jgi:hypothetical protein
VGKRARRRGQAAVPIAPESEYRRGGDDVLVLRGALSPASRREYADLAGRVREDRFHRQVEFLFERLAARWEVAGVEYGPKEVLPRLRMASEDERAWVRDALREHVREWFPDVEAP